MIPAQWYELKIINFSLLGPHGKVSCERRVAWPSLVSCSHKLLPCGHVIRYNIYLGK
jgi:hypothetical protein